MRVLTINGPKAGSIIFACLCAVVILYFGFFSQNTVAVSSDIDKPTTYVAVIVNGFGTGSDGTKDFLYMGIPFTAIINQSGSSIDEDTKALKDINAEIANNVDLTNLEVYKIENKNNISSIQDKISKVLDKSQMYAIFFVNLGTYANNTAQAIRALDQDPDYNLEFVTISELLSLVE